MIVLVSSLSKINSNSDTLATREFTEEIHMNLSERRIRQGYLI